MGNDFDKSNLSKKDFEHFNEMLDYIASNYILSLDFQNLQKLDNDMYCQDLIVLTSEIIDKYFNSMDLTYLDQRIKNGIEVNKKKKDNLYFISKNSLENMDVKNGYKKNIKKRRICKSIASFYVKIAHLFSTILKTINPVYVYKDEYNHTIQKDILHKKEIPEYAQIQKKLNINICDNRIRSLQSVITSSKQMNEDGTIDENGEKRIKTSTFCKMNMGEYGHFKNVEDEPGMSELIQLYYDDGDYPNEFNKMSERNKEQFQKDLSLFYKTFTGNNDMPSHIQKFSDIKLKLFNQNIICENYSEIQINENDNLLKQYANHIQKMIQNASSNQSRLLTIINNLFLFVKDPNTNTKKIRIHPHLTEKKLEELTLETRKIIIHLYLQCEKDFLHGMKILEAIIEKKILETTKNQIENLEKKKKEIMFKLQH
jgi:hypothetical protein